MKVVYNMMIAVSVFFIFLIIFTHIYKNYAGYDDNDSLYISTSFQTFTGNQMVENNKKAKRISIIQMIISYVLMVIILHFLIKL